MDCLVREIMLKAMHMYRRRLNAGCGLLARLSSGPMHAGEVIAAGDSKVHQQALEALQWFR